MRTCLYILLVGLLQMLVMVTNAGAQTVRLNSVTEVTAGSFLLGRPDPQIVFSYAQPVDTSGRGIRFDINLAAPRRASAGAPAAVTAQFFWANNTHGFEQKFSIKFPLNMGANALFIPMGMLDNNITDIRIDVDGCECLLVMNEPRWQQDSASQKTLYPPGVADYVALKWGRDLPPESWVGVQFDSPSAGVYEFAGWDPRIVSAENLNVPLDVAAGIYFDFNYNLPFKYHKYELFWELDNLPWSQLRSAHFILPSDAQGEFKVFIPFANLYSSKKLQRLRLDFEACENCRLQVRQARLVGYNEIEKFQSLEPERLYYVHTEKPPKRVMSKAIREKLSSDVAFFVIWILLIVSVIGAGLFLMIKSPSNRKGA